MEFSKNREYRVIGEFTLGTAEGPITLDLSVYRREPLDLHHDEVRAAEPPLLAVEILSPSQGIQEVMDKLGD